MRRRLIALSVALAAAGVAFAADPLPPPAVATSGDLDLTHRARAALAADPLLRDAPLLVSVLDGGLVAGGPVGSEAAAARVAEVLRAVPGVRDVRVSCWVPAGAADPLAAAVRRRIEPAPAPPTAVVAAAPEPLGTVVAQRYETIPRLLLDPTPPRRSAVGGYSPVPPPLPAPAVPPAGPTIPPPAVPVTPGQDVAAAVDEVRRADRRFAGLTVTVTGGTVTIGGRAIDPGDAWELADAVRKVPGVDRIVVGRVGR
jgi:osmotically-inducible protein OsmY